MVSLGLWKEHKAATKKSKPGQTPVIDNLKTDPIAHFHHGRGNDEDQNAMMMRRCGLVHHEVEDHVRADWMIKAILDDFTFRWFTNAVTLVIIAVLLLEILDALNNSILYTGHIILTLMQMAEMVMRAFCKEYPWSSFVSFADYLAVAMQLYATMLVSLPAMGYPEAPLIVEGYSFGVLRIFRLVDITVLRLLPKSLSRFRFMVDVMKAMTVRTVCSLLVLNLVMSMMAGIVIRQSIGVAQEEEEEEFQLAGYWGTFPQSAFTCLALSLSTVSSWSVGVAEPLGRVSFMSMGFLVAFMIFIRMVWNSIVKALWLDLLRHGYAIDREKIQEAEILRGGSLMTQYHWLQHFALSGHSTTIGSTDLDKAGCKEKLAMILDIDEQMLTHCFDFLAGSQHGKCGRLDIEDFLAEITCLKMGLMDIDVILEDYHIRRVGSVITNIMADMRQLQRKAGDLFRKVMEDHEIERQDKSKRQLLSAKLQTVEADIEHLLQATMEILGGDVDAPGADGKLSNNPVGSETCHVVGAEDKHGQRTGPNMSQSMSPTETPRRSELAEDNTAVASAVPKQREAFHESVEASRKHKMNMKLRQQIHELQSQAAAWRMGFTELAPKSGA